jgi:hypothetical protein
MMDHERTEKELQEIFEEIQHSYKTLVDNVFTLPRFGVHASLPSFLLSKGQ